MKVFLAFLAIAAVLYTASAEIEEEFVGRKFKNVKPPHRLLTGVPAPRPKFTHKLVLPKFVVHAKRFLTRAAPPKRKFIPKKIVVAAPKPMMTSAVPPQRKFVPKKIVVAAPKQRMSSAVNPNVPKAPKKKAKKAKKGKKAKKAKKGKKAQ